MDFISPLLECFNTYVISPIGAKFQVFRNIGENIKELETARDNLVATREDKRGEVEEEKKQEGVEESAGAKLWFTQFDGALSEINNLLSDYNTLQNQNEQRCRNCFCWSRYQLSKRVLKHKKEVVMLYEFADRKSGWTVAPAAQKGKKLDTVYSIGSQTTTEKLKHKIINAVLNDSCVVVGLHGMGGVGKTTLLRHVNNHFISTDHFRSVIFTTISATPNFVEIRKQIAQGFGLRINSQDDDDVKQKLSRHSSATGTGKYLLILDDMWEPLDLGEICIPAPKKDNGCKILTASREKSVATRFVAVRDSLQLIPVNILPEDEAWNLFVQKVGTAITSRPEIVPLAKKVLRKCDGLPLAITVVGGTMSTRETRAGWEDALRELKKSASNLEHVEEKVFSKLIFSFENLPPIEQSLFLYCCLFPEDDSIRNEFLFNFAIGEESLLCDEMHRVGDMRNKVDSLVEKLQNSSMLEDGDYPGTSIKMHDVMRGLGVWITSNKYQYSSKYIAKARAGLTEAPDASEWPKVTKISLMDNRQIKSLPQLPEQCPLLHTLFLQGCFGIKEIPQVHFLEHMPALGILDLSGTRIRNLPPSISHLVNLRLLCLRNCEYLEELPPEIGMLVQLIMLDLYGCGSLRKLPVGMKELKNLRDLNIGFTFQLKEIPRGVLSGLHKLEVLDTDGSGLKWYPKDIGELFGLTRLTSIWIPEIRKVKVSHEFKPLIKCMRNLYLWNCDIDPSVLPDLLEDSTNILTHMKFISCKGLICVPTGGYTYLKVRGCPDLKALLIVEETKRKRNAFESLCELKLDQLDQLETICTGVPQLGCFSNLETIKIQACPNLKVLFTNGVARLLKKLEVLRVYRCSQLMKLVSDDEDLEIDDAFPSLEEITIWACPNLKVHYNKVSL